MSGMRLLVVQKALFVSSGSPLGLSSSRLKPDEPEVRHHRVAAGAYGWLSFGSESLYNACCDWKSSGSAAIASLYHARVAHSVRGPRMLLQARIRPPPFLSPLVMARWTNEVNRSSLAAAWP